jgi:hypothetical protein
MRIRGAVSRCFHKSERSCYFAGFGALRMSKTVTFSREPVLDGLRVFLDKGGPVGVTSPIEAGPNHRHKNLRAL